MHTFAPATKPATCADARCHLPATVRYTGPGRGRYRYCHAHAAHRATHLRRNGDTVRWLVPAPVAPVSPGATYRPYGPQGIPDVRHVRAADHRDRLTRKPPTRFRSKDQWGQPSRLYAADRPFTR